MYYHIDDFARDWAQEREGTLTLLRALTDASLAVRATPDTRSLGELAWHITLTLGEMPARAGLTADAPPEDAPVPASAAALADAYDRASRSVADLVAAHWTDADLADMVNMYGEEWPKGMVLSVLLVHQVHHRGQMTVLMRMAGLRVHGVYGPAREEWAAMGMEAPAF